MNLAFMIAGLDQGKKILRLCDLLLQENYAKPVTFSPSKFSIDFFQASQDEDYYKEYKVAIKNRDYDLLLKDYSFFQFSCEESEGKDVRYRYAYYESPTNFPTYEEFLQSLNLSYQECGEAFYEDYEQVIHEAKLKVSVTPLRYDYDETLYEKLVHPVSHLHIGCNNEIRLPFKYLIPPHAFVVFVIRHIYWKNWKKLIYSSKELYKTYFVKGQCTSLNSSYFVSDEENDFYIS